MVMIAVCDACGRQQPAIALNHNWYTPHDWYEGSAMGENTIVIACSRRCIVKTEAKRTAEGKQPMTVLAPF